MLLFPFRETHVPLLHPWLSPGPVRQLQPARIAASGRPADRQPAGAPLDVAPAVIGATELPQRRIDRPSDEPRPTLAAALRADSTHSVDVRLPHDARRAQVPAFVRNETTWSGQLPQGFGAVPNKMAYELDGRPLYPELLVVRLLELAGWGAAWRNSWNGDAFWRDLHEPMSPPTEVMAAIDQVSAYASHTGQWDIVAWRDRQLRLLASRPQGGQPVSAYQAAWLSIALRMGLPAGCFAIVEHRVARPPRRRRLEHVAPV